MAEQINLMKLASQQHQAKKNTDFEKRRAAVEKLRTDAVSKYGKLPQAKRDKMTQNQYVLAVLGKAANRKMVAIEKKGVTTPAHKEANKWLSLNTDRTRFSTNPAKLDSDQVERELYHVMKFLRAKSSTVTGHNQIKKKREQTFKDMGLSEDDLNTLFTQLGKKKFGTSMRLLSSDQIIDLYKNADTRDIISGADLEELTDEQKMLINKTVGRFLFEGVEPPDIEEEEPALFDIERKEDYE